MISGLKLLAEQPQFIKCVVEGQAGVAAPFDSLDGSQGDYRHFMISPGTYVVSLQS